MTPTRLEIGVFVLSVAVSACSGSSTQAPADSSPAASVAESFANGASGAPGAAAATTPSGDATPARSALAASEVPPAPTFKEITIPSGAPLSLRLSSSIASDTSRVDERVRAVVSKPVLVDGVVALPEGAEVVGAVVEANESGRVKGRASVAVRFNEVSAWHTSHEIETDRISRQAAATKKKDATKIGIGAGAGALVGAIAGGKKGAAIGSAVGGGAGTGVVLATRGDEVRLGPGAILQTRLRAPLTVRVPSQE